MSKWFGKIGYSMTTEIEPGLWIENQIIEREYYGELLKNISRRYQNASDKVNDDVTISNDLSILADPFARDNFANIKYVVIMGSKWKVNNVEIQYPRLIISLGGLYNE